MTYNLIATTSQPAQTSEPALIYCFLPALISCFLLHYQKYDVFYALPFFQELQKAGFNCSDFNILL